MSKAAWAPRTSTWSNYTTASRANELITYEALGLCPEGKGGEFVDAGANTYGGKVVVNPSGGLISKGHPLGATGLAQCAELNWQLRGEADKRQVSGAKGRPPAQSRTRRSRGCHDVSPRKSGLIFVTGDSPCDRLENQVRRVSAAIVADATLRFASRQDE